MTSDSLREGCVERAARNNDSIEVGATRSMNRPVRRMVSKQRREAIQDMMESFDAIDEEVGVTWFD